MRGKSIFWMAFLITIITLTWADIKNCHDLPWPPRYIGAGITFGMLDLFSIVSEELASVVAIGIVMAVVINKGFKPDCMHSGGTVQPASYNSIIPGQGTQTV